MGEGQGGWKDAVRRVLRRNQGSNQAAATEPNDKEFLLPEGEFTRNTIAEERLRGIVVNPDAVKAGKPEVRLVDSDEAVINFIGEPDKFVDFVKKAQANPLRDYPHNPFVNGKWLNTQLRRTGIEVQIDFESSSSGKKNYIRPENPDGLPIRMELVGAEIRDGNVEVYYLYPWTGSISVPTPGEISRTHRVQSGFGIGTFPEENVRGKVDYLKYVSKNPFLPLSERELLISALDDGSFFSGFHHDESHGFQRSPGNYLLIERRRPSPGLRIDPHYVSSSSLASGGKNLELIVPQAAAKNLTY